jgi:hypothetical protein
MSGGSNNLSWEARGALVTAGVVTAGVEYAPAPMKIMRMNFGFAEFQ